MEASQGAIVPVAARQWQEKLGCVYIVCVQFNSSICQRLQVVTFPRDNVSHAVDVVRCRTQHPVSHQFAEPIVGY